MPQFELNEDAASEAHSFYELDDFAKGYVEAMFFTNGDTGLDAEDKLNQLGVARLTKEAVQAIRKDCDAFQALAKPLLDRAYDGVYEPCRSGHDFWLTRQGHGSGFWSRDELDDTLGERLSRVAQTFGESYCEVARGWIYVR